MLKHFLKNTDKILNVYLLNILLLFHHFQRFHYQQKNKFNTLIVE